MDGRRWRIFFWLHARAHGGEGSSSDEEVVSAVEPAMSMIPGGGLTILISTAYRKRGLMYRRWKELFGNDRADDICWVADTTTMNPLMPPEIVAKAMAEDPARARSEYLSQWREDLADFIPADAIELCTDWGVRERPRVAGAHAVAFCDAAGGSGTDSFTLGIATLRQDRSITLDVLRERVPRFVPAAVVGEFSALLKSRGITAVKGDHYSGGWCADEFGRNGIRYVPSAQTKSEIYLAALPLLLSGRARLLDDEKLRRQLSGLERRAHANGRESVDHAAGSAAHDDVANAACGALVHAARNTNALNHHGPMVIYGGRPGELWSNGDPWRDIYCPALWPNDRREAGHG
jgi:hypothetical protein